VLFLQKKYIYKKKASKIENFYLHKSPSSHHRHSVGRLPSDCRHCRWWQRRSLRRLQRHSLRRWHHRSLRRRQRRSPRRRRRWSAAGECGRHPLKEQLRQTRGDNVAELFILKIKRLFRETHKNFFV